MRIFALAALLAFLLTLPCVWPNRACQAASTAKDNAPKTLTLSPETSKKRAAASGQTVKASSPEKGNAPRTLTLSQEASKKPAATSGQTVKTEYFSIHLPKDWFMVFPPSKKPDGVSAVFSNDKTGVAVTLNVFRAPLGLKEFADITVGSLKQGGLAPSPAQTIGKMSKISLAGQAKGLAWLAANGKLCTATLILEQHGDIGSANAFLGAIESKIGDMFPKRLQ